MRRVAPVLLGAVAVGLLTACGLPVRTGMHFAREIDPSQAPTFAWDQSADRVAGDPRLEGNRFFEERLHEAVEWQLALRGIHPAESAPTLLVHHHLSLADHELEEETRDAADRRVSEPETYEMGTIVVHLSDAASGETVWIGWAQAEIEPALTGPEGMRRWVYDVVGEMFRRWPTLERAAR